MKASTLIKASFIAVIVLALCSCAMLQQKMGETSIDSYLQGCIYRGVEQGIERNKAVELCECHVDAAIKKSSQQEFLDATGRLARASKEERLSGMLNDEISLVKGTFKQCKTDLGI
ncbi:MAG: hypothetical protein KUG73_09870 [Pseudomonadales bacterium]|nr:hypothetical protein [Pseudomonadales bacterium]